MKFTINDIAVFKSDTEITSSMGEKLFVPAELYQKVNRIKQAIDNLLPNQARAIIEALSVKFILNHFNGGAPFTSENFDVNFLMAMRFSDDSHQKTETVWHVGTGSLCIDGQWSSADILRNWWHIISDPHHDHETTYFIAKALVEGVYWSIDKLHTKMGKNFSNLGNILHKYSLALNTLNPKQ